MVFNKKSFYNLGIFFLIFGQKMVKVHIRMSALLIKKCIALDKIVMLRQSVSKECDYRYITFILDQNVQLYQSIIVYHVEQSYTSK